ncbi:hypothetical protein ASN86_00650 [Streptococcus parauberis]|nr:hypothetical protein [Streptococcus parauberis]PNY19758.1 hypothetical protein ASN86_00650 [Streptococcus parauberis]
MNPSEKLDRRIDISSDISDYVYKYERAYAKSLKEGSSEAVAKSDAQDDVMDYFNNSSKITISDSMYDKETGIVAIAVKDKQTGETYIA